MSRWLQDHSTTPAERASAPMALGYSTASGRKPLAPLLRFRSCASLSAAECLSLCWSRGIRNSFGCARAPASLCVVLEGSPDDKLLTLSAFDPLKGRGKVLTTIGKDPSLYYASALSPDGSIFAHFENWRGRDSHSLAFTLRRVRKRDFSEELAEPHRWP